LRGGCLPLPGRTSFSAHGCVHATVEGPEERSFMLRSMGTGVRGGKVRRRRHPGIAGPCDAQRTVSR
jgi:hypothetical protein